MDNQNFIAPQGAMTMTMVAPESNSGFTKRDDIQLLPNGLHPGVIYAVVGLGTHMESFNNEAPKENNKIHIGIEFPQLKQLFYMEDTAPRSTVGSLEGAFSMASKAKLRALVEAVRGVSFASDDEAALYDVSQLLGAKVLCNMTTVARKRGPGNYNKIVNFAPLGTYPLPPNFNPENEYHIFAVDPAGNNFKTVNFANLPSWLKKTVMESNEAKKYALAGGQFAKKPETNQQGQTQQTQGQQAQIQHQAQPQQQQSQPQAPQQNAPQPVAVKTFILTDTEFTMEQWRKAGWNEDALVAAKKGIWQMPEPAAPAPPQGPPNAGVLPQAPQAPQQQIPQTPQAPDQVNVFEEDEDDYPY